jgi:hypothetical protein
MDLFTPVVPGERQHPNFRALIERGLECERDVLRTWANGFVDRDGKFVTEFQTTFNSSFWELYLHAAFRELGFTLDFTRPAPDFSAMRHGLTFAAEAAIASHADGFAAEWDADPGEELSDDRKRAMLEYASVRLANAFDGKLRRYRTSYSRMAHVAGKPYIICLAPFEQPFSYVFAERAVRRLLYAFDMPVYLDDAETGRRVILGESAAERVWKASGAEVEFGLFTDGRAAEVSAVIYSSVATFGKVQALAPPERASVFTALRYNATGPQAFLITAPRQDYEEGVLDGLHVFLNPHAAIPLDPTTFLHPDIAIHHGFDDELRIVRTDTPHGFLFSRSVLGFGTRQENAAPKRRSDARGRIAELEPWTDGQLHRVGGHVTTFTDNHLAHYKGWTILVARDRIDNDWGAQACEGIYRDVFSFFEGQRSDSTKSLMGSAWVPTREEAFAMMKDEIDAIPRSENGTPVG